MADFIEDAGAYPIMVALAGCAEAEIERRGLEPVVVTIQPGEPVLDYVGNPGSGCGELIISMPQAYAVDEFPNPTEDPNCVTWSLAYDIEIGIFRCAAPLHGTKQAPKPPTPAEQQASARQVTADMAAAVAAIKCCLRGTNRSYVMRGYTPYGPAGNAVGGVWSFTVAEPDPFD